MKKHAKFIWGFVAGTFLGGMVLKSTERLGRQVRERVTIAVGRFVGQRRAPGGA